MKVAFLNTYGQSGLTSQKLIELENFIEHNRLDIVCLQETDIQENTFSGCSILNRFIPIINNSKSGYGTCTLVRNIFTYENVIKDSEGRLISVDVKICRMLTYIFIVEQIKQAEIKGKTTLIIYQIYYFIRRKMVFWVVT